MAECIWPDCLSDAQQTELAAEVHAAWGGEATTPRTGQRTVCGCGETTPVPDLRQRIADALRAAAHRCDGDCGMDERACHAAHPIQEAAATHGVITDLYGPIEAIAGVVADAVQPPVDKRRIQLARALGLPEDSDWLEALVVVVKNRQAADRVREDEARISGPEATTDPVRNASSPMDGAPR